MVRIVPLADLLVAFEQCGGVEDRIRFMLAATEVLSTMKVNSKELRRVGSEICRTFIVGFMWGRL